MPDPITNTQLEHLLKFIGNGSLPPERLIAIRETEIFTSQEIVSYSLTPSP
jgi:hypothetical protein